MRVGITGTSGFMGRALAQQLQASGHELHRFSRGSTGELAIDPRVIESLDVIVHLAGESVSKRWTPARKRAILESRVQGTRKLSEAIAASHRRPALVAASAIGFYGNRPNTPVDESSEAGQGFLSEVCVAAERAADAARQVGARVCHLRLGIVLDPSGGALAQMLPAFRTGGGAVIGDGQQWMSWVSRQDALRAFAQAATDSAWSGPVNIVAPTPERQRDFAKILAHALHRPCFLRLPAAVVRVMFGEMGQALLLEGAAVKPMRLGELGFVHADPDLVKFLSQAVR